MKKLIVLIACFVTSCIFFVSTVSAQQTEPVGIILATVGTVTAANQNGQERRLRRRAPIYSGDTLTTAKNGRVQIRFNDNGLVTLSPQTSFVVDNHEYDVANVQNSRAKYRLLRGGMQAITGLIGKFRKQDYSVNTPLATIGLRGTHWYMLICDAQCVADGIADSQGLHGGVFEGGVDVCNSGGCSDADANEFFFVSNPDQRATISLQTSTNIDAIDIDVNDDSEAGVGDVSNKDVQSVKAAAEDTFENQINIIKARLIARISSAAGGNNEPAEGSLETVENNPGQTLDEGSVADITALFDEQTDPDLLADINRLVALRDNLAEAPIILPTEPPHTAVNSGLAIFTSLIQRPASDNSNTILAGSGRFDAASALIETVEQESGTAVARITTNTDSELCPACRYDIVLTTGNSAQLVEYNTVSQSGIDFTFQRWRGDAEYSINGNAETTLPDHHIIYASNFTSNIEGISDLTSDFALNSPIAIYERTASTAITDSDGSVGSLDSLRVGLDLAMNQLVSWDLEGSIGEIDIRAELLRDTTGNASPISFTDTGITGASITGFCLGGRCGEGIGLGGAFNLLFAGDDASSIFGDYFLLDNAEYGLNGTYLAQYSTTEADNYIAANTSIAASDGQYISFTSDLGNANSAGIFSTGFVADSSGGDSINLISVGLNDNVFAGASRASNFDPACDSCSFNLQEGTLVESGIEENYLNTGVDVNWGRWFASSDFERSGTLLTTGENIHYIGFSNVTNLSDVDASFSVPSIGRYQLSEVPGVTTSPTDEQGRTGSLNDLFVEVDFFSDAIVRFDFDISIDDRRYIAGLRSEANVSDTDAILAGSCSGGDCGEGQSLAGITNFQFFGEQAQGLAGSYGLVTVESQEDINNFNGIVAEREGALTANGTFLISQTSLTVADDFVEADNITDNQMQAPTGSTGVLLGFADPTSSSQFLPFVLGAGESTNTSNDETANVEFEATESQLNVADLTNVGSLLLADLILPNGDLRQNVVTSVSQPNINDGNILECSPCIQVNNGFLREYNRINDFAGSSTDITWGRWDNAQISAQISNEDGSLTAANVAEHALFLQASELTSSLPTDAGIGVYRYVGGPSPINATGETGVIDSIDMTIDFIQQGVTDFALNFTVADRIYNAQRDDLLPVSYLNNNNTGFDFNLRGTCTGGHCGEDFISLGGESGGLLVGNADGVLGGFTLTPTDVLVASEQPGIAVAGAYVLGLDTQGLQPHPNSFDINSDPAPSLVQVVDGSSIGFFAGLLDSFGYSEPETLRLLSNMESGNSFGLVSVASQTNVIAQFRQSVIDIYGGETLTTFDVTQGILAESGSVSSIADESVNIVWGRWLGSSELARGTQFESSTSLNNIDLFSSQHVLYIENGAGTFANPATPTIGRYEFLNGTAPTTEENRVGVINSINVDVDFFSQEIVRFDLSADVEERHYFAELAMPSPFNSADSSSTIEQIDASFSHILNGGRLSLTGRCSGGTCADNTPLMGFTSLAPIGSNSNGFAGTFALSYDQFNIQTTDTARSESDPINLIGLSGAYVLQQAEVIDSPRWLTGTINSSTLDTGGFAVAYMSGDVNSAQVQSLLLNGVDDAVQVTEIDNIQNALQSALLDSGEQLTIRDAVLTDTGMATHPDVSLSNSAQISWGMWRNRSDFISNAAGDISTFDSLPFVFADSLTQVLPTNSLLGGSEGFYIYSGGPSPIENTGVEGDITSLSMGVDFASQEVTSFDIGLSFATDEVFQNRFYFLSMAQSEQPAKFEGTGITLNLTGDCSGCLESSPVALEGEANVQLAGEVADAAIGSLAVESKEDTVNNVSEGQFAVQAAFALEQTFNPTFVDKDKLSNTVKAVDVQQPEDTEHQATYWGRWASDSSLAASASGDAAMTDTAYADLSSANATQYSVNEAGERFLVHEQAMVGSYSYINDSGMQPTDAQGNVGRLESIDMSLDFAEQQVTSFDLVATGADSTRYEVGLVGVSALDAVSPSTSFDLTGTCQGGDCGAGASANGSSSLLLIGAEAENVMGIYEVGSDISGEHYNGSYWLEQTELTPVP